ncbi:MAG: multidrug MFS transporter [Weissella confusa]|nr:multidrug MFS transporter [Weissella confusa]
MIFVTVGTHEQGFNRLLQMMDSIAMQTDEPIFAQIGYSTYEPLHYKYTDFLTYSEMHEYIDEASRVITHGGAATFLSVLASGKTPIVVPRLKKFQEHVNDHQLNFVEHLIENGYSLTLVKQYSELENAISASETTASRLDLSDAPKLFVTSLEVELSRLQNHEGKR